MADAGLTILPDREAMLRHVPTGGCAVEVGTWCGDFAQEIWSIVQPQRLVLIDTWEDYFNLPGNTIYEEVQRRFRDCAGVEFWQGLSHERIQELEDNSVDFAYVDADHTYAAVLRDLELLLPKMRVGGWLCGHDYCCCDDYGVVRATAVLCDRHGLSINVMTDERLHPVTGSSRQHYPPEVSYNSYGIRVSR